MAELNPTTKAQVSGHKFLKRRVEHGLIMGDIRMIHDPLARRKRALTFGVAGTALIGVGAGAMALFAPKANPGDAAIIAAESGQLFVKVEDAYHPVSNLASARLVSGEAATPAKADDDILAEMPKSIPVGIVDAPSIIGDQSALPDLRWLVCHQEATRVNRLDNTPDRVTFVVDNDGSAQPFSMTHGGTSVPGVLARVDNNGVVSDYLITENGRMKLPDEESPEGRTVRRNLGVNPQTPLWIPPSDLISAFREVPEFSVPAGQSKVWVTNQTGNEVFWLNVDGRIAQLTELQANILSELGVTRESVSFAQVSQLPDFRDQLNIPQSEVNFIDPQDEAVCVNERGNLSSVKRDKIAEPSPLGGESVATHFAGLGRSIAVDTGSGKHLIAETGLRHQIASSEAHDALGLSREQEIPWALLRMLPEGSELSRANAMQPLY